MFLLEADPALLIAGGGLLFCLCVVGRGVHFFEDDSAGLFDANGSGVHQLAAGC